MVWRIISLLVYWGLIVWLALYAGIGYAILMGYLCAISLLILPLNRRWVASKPVRLILGRLDTPEAKAFFGIAGKSRKYAISIIIAAIVLLGVAILIILKLNIKLSEAF